MGLKHAVLLPVSPWLRCDTCACTWNLVAIPKPTKNTFCWTFAKLKKPLPAFVPSNFYRIRKCDGNSKICQKLSNTLVLFRESSFWPVFGPDYDSVSLFTIIMRDVHTYSSVSRRCGDGGGGEGGVKAPAYQPVTYWLYEAQPWLDWLIAVLICTVRLLTTGCTIDAFFFPSQSRYTHIIHIIASKFSQFTLSISAFFSFLFFFSFFVTLLCSLNQAPYRNRRGGGTILIMRLFFSDLSPRLSGGWTLVKAKQSATRRDVFQRWCQSEGSMWWRLAIRAQS